MKKIIQIFLILQFYGCYNIYGLFFNEKKTNIISSVQHKDYTLDKELIDINSGPQSIIFIIADGTGIGQYTLSYYTSV